MKKKLLVITTLFFLIIDANSQELKKLSTRFDLLGYVFPIGIMHERYDGGYSASGNFTFLNPTDIAYSFGGTFSNFHSKLGNNKYMATLFIGAKYSKDHLNGIYSITDLSYNYASGDYRGGADVGLGYMLPLQDKLWADFAITYSITNPLSFLRDNEVTYSCIRLKMGLAI